MPEHLNDKTIFSLAEVALSIQKTLEARYTSAFWVKAELNKLNLYRQSGHCYPDLVDKQEGKLVAQLRAYLWKDDFNRINARFLNTLKEPLKDGIKILFQARIAFDPVHGLALRILDIDPAFTLGDLEREKQACIQRLLDEGLFNRNKTLSLPILPQRIAVISVETSKGYADFKSVLDHNPWDYRFFYMLFPSLLQGDQALDSLINQLHRVAMVKQHFDAVAIIRGGGGEVGLTVYNKYELAKAIALCPLPVLTGIGHSTNLTVAEMVAHTNTIVPAQTAEFLIQKFHNFSVPLQKAQSRISEIASRNLNQAKQQLQSEAKLLKTITHKMLMNNLQQLQFTEKELTTTAKLNLKSIAIELNHAQNQVKLLDPINILKRGYSITRMNGKSIKTSSQLKSGDIVETTLYDGQIKSIIT